MDIKDMIGLGAGGHASVVIDLVRVLGGSVHGLLVGPGERAEEVDGVPILGRDELLAELHERGHRSAFLGVGSTTSTAIRERLFGLCVDHGFDLPRLVHPRSVVAASAEIAAGCQVLAGAVINPRAQIARGGLINTGAIIEHGCILAPWVHCSPGVVLGGDVRVGARAHVGLGATVMQGIQIGDDATVGAGAVVTRDVPRGVTVIGVPARPVGRRP